mgnify:CR=1 FL=1
MTQSEIQMRESFNWSQLDRNNLYSMLYTAGRDIVGKKLPVNVLQKHISSYIKTYLPVRVVKAQNNKKHKPTAIYVGGTYYSDLDKKKQDGKVKEDYGRSPIWNVFGGWKS